MAQTLLRDYLQQTEDAISSGQIDEALSNCQNILTHFPESLEGQRLLGEVYLAQGHLQDAQQSFDWVLISDPENVVAYCDRALISERMSDYDTALDCYQQAYELSRGNSQIRQEFNELSAKVGQPRFMFSRAGLARLYMRGDLLLQAIQEWETVLTSTPDRLDARTGFMETLWREGLYERVEQTAKQILNEIPTCLKALLLLAYVTYPHNASQARELIRQAETLDPELIMAQELFSDLLVRQPNDPFLALIKKEPITFPEATSGPLASRAPLGPSTTNTSMTNGTSNVPLSTDPLFGWSTLDSDVTVQEDLQEPTEFSAWSNTDLQDFDARKVESKDTDLPSPPAWLDMLTQGERNPTSGALPPSPSTQQEQAESPTALPPSPLPPPEPIAAMPSISSPFQIEAAPIIPVEPEAQVLQEEVPQTTPLSPLPFSPDDNDAENWPEWLKSLGAAEMESGPNVEDTAIEPEPKPLYTQSKSNQANAAPAPKPPSPARSDQPTAPSAQQAPSWTDQLAEPFSQQSPSSAPAWPDQPAAPPAQQAPSWMDQLAEPFSQQPPSPAPAWSDQPTEPTAQQAPSWMDQMANSFAQQASSPGRLDQPAEHPAQQISATSKGQEATSKPESDLQMMATLENLEQSLHAQGFVELAPGSLSSIAQSNQEPTLSSALAQLGSLPPAPATSAQDIPAASQTVTPPAQPSWFATSAVHPTPDSMSYPTSYSPVRSPLEPSATPLYRADALLENELETTMKRPAVRLQPVQQRPPVQRDVAAGISQARAPERAETGATSESNLSPRERLLRGYQFQLAGDYDEAMQEYRIIIRSTSELLAEVISNVRALLKLAPKYSAGYRVLGDAYMRQGEYLQAMEAYNKALSMNKKAKGG